MPLQTAVLNGAAAGATALLGFASIHSANPGNTGASEITGGAPAYARKAAVWGGPVGAVDTAAALNFDMPAGSTAAYVGFWSAVTGGTWRGGAALSAAEVFTGQGVYTLDSATVTAS